MRAFACFDCVRVNMPWCQVMGGSHTWLYNKLLKLFSERINTVVQV